jgi:dipeptidyl aminopeptidase/acylaminoacyl peptidase/CubicO group peptidase (beta-lactamase class C family)
MAGKDSGSPAGHEAERSGRARRARLDDGYALQIPASPAISPDGGRVVYVLRTSDRGADQDRWALWQVSADGGDPLQLTRGPADTAPAWSPDGRRIAFLRGGDAPAQIWLLPAAAGEPEQLTRLPAGAGPPAWSPDGSRIAFSAPVDGRAADWHAGGAGGDERREREPVVIDRLGYKADGSGLLRALRRHLHVADLATGEVRQVTHGDWHAGDPAWSPDGRRLALPAALTADADLTGASAAYVVDLASDQTPRLIGSADGVAGPVTWAPGGDALLVAGIHQVRSGHTRLWRVPLDGSPPAELTAGLDRNVMPSGPGYPGGMPAVSADGMTILFCARDRGCTCLFTVGAENGAPRQVLGGNGRVVAGLSVARAAGRAAVVVADPGSFGEVAVVDLADSTTRVVTSHTRRALPDVELLVPAERAFTVSDGTQVHGWLLRDPAASSPTPLLLDIHGGPHNAWSPAADAAHLYHQVLAARGFAVLLLNPRGSDGYGEEFFTAAIGAWGTADERDLLEPVDQLIAEGVADPARLAVAGYSYGGFMTCHLTAGTSRFGAAVAGGLVCDLTSMAGTSDDGHLLTVLELGSTAQARQEAQRSLSPIARAGQVSTPTLILHGAADDRCPPGQAEQWFTALREQGVPAQMVLYPGASHLFILDGRPSHRADYGRRVTSWVTGNLRPAAQGPARGGRWGALLDSGRWQSRLSELARRHEVPGAALGILRTAPGGGDSEGDQVALAAHGVLNLGTSAAVTQDSLFQIGSMTKVWTATLVMQLSDEGHLDLDAPLAGLIPDLKLPGDLASCVTLRHLLTHTSGIDGDVFTDTGRGDDCLEKYAALLAGAGVTHPLGATFSYCNSGFVLAGRVIEVLTGMTWDAALLERLIKPLGLTRTCTLPEDVLLHQAAAGHIGEPGEPLRVASAWTLPRALGPAGLICSTPAEVLAFARLHLAGGTTADGRRVLSAASVTAMQGREVDLPDPHTLGDSWGLGWIRYGWNGCRAVGHDGNTIGQSAFLRMLPSAGMAVTLLANGGHTRDLFQDLFREIFREEAGVEMPPPLAPAAGTPRIDPARYTGTYERASLRTEIIERDGGLALRSTVTGPLAALTGEPVHCYDLVPAGTDLFVMRQPGVTTWTPVRFYRIADGTACLHYGGRANPKVA